VYLLSRNVNLKIKYKYNCINVSKEVINLDVGDKQLAEAVIKYLCLNGEINGVRFGPSLQILLCGNYEHKKGITGQVYLNVESRWCIYDELPNEYPMKESDIEGLDRVKELEILNELSYTEIVDVKLGGNIPHLILTFQNGKSLFVHGHDEQYESWQLGVSFQSDDSWLVVACPGDGIAV
jgi:hypothetical protein